MHVSNQTKIQYPKIIPKRSLMFTLGPWVVSQQAKIVAF